MVLTLVILVALVTASLISIKLQKVISYPILSLAGTADRVSKQKDYSIRGEKQSEDEIGLLIDSFNDMLSQIQKRDSELEKEIKVRKRAEESLKYEKEFTDSILEALIDTVFVFDLEFMYESL